jgi:hypothetical protein
MLTLFPGGLAKSRGWTKKSLKMVTAIAFMEVDDVGRWLKSTKRRELLGSLRISGKVFVDPAQSNRVGVYAEIPDVAALQAFMQSETGTEAMRADGVRLESFVMPFEAADHL